MSSSDPPMQPQPRAPWSRPALTRFGSVAELTRGENGSLDDADSAVCARKAGTGPPGAGCNGL